MCAAKRVVNNANPLWLCIGLMSAGIAMGYTLPCPWYLPAAILSLLLGTLLFALRRGNGYVLLLFWLCLGAARADMGTLLPQPCITAWEAIQRDFAHRSEALAHRLHEAGVPPEEFALGEALLLGRRQGISNEVRRAYSQSGTAHLLALSGLHLGILYGMLHLLVIRRLRRSEWRWFALPWLLLLVWGYVLLAGMPLSLVRAAVMCTVVMTASLSRQQSDAMHALGISALVILLASPRSLLSISFQLSFTAVFFILSICARPARRPHLWSRVGQSALASAAAWLGTAPLTAYWFHSISLLSIPLSLLLIPLTTLIVYLAVATLLLPIPLLGTCLGTLIGVQNHIVMSCAHLPGVVIDGLHPTWWQVVIVYAVLLIAILRLNISRSRTGLTVGEDNHPTNL